MDELAFITADTAVATALDLRGAVWGAPRTLRTPPMPTAEFEAIVPDTDVAWTAAEMTAAFDRLGTPTRQPEVELTVDPDEYPLF